jgi:hypothetical protein
MPDTSTLRSINILTHLTNLNSSHEWYTVELHIGHPSNFTLLNGSPPWLTLSYKSAVTGDIQRRVGLCGQVELPFISGPGECEFEGKDGQLYQRYGMDTRSLFGRLGRGMYRFMWMPCVFGRLSGVRCLSEKSRWNRKRRMCYEFPL